VVGEDGLASSLDEGGIGGGKEKIGLVYKALICLGDVERYREQYDERVRREVREGRMEMKFERFDKAWGYYEAARGLNPDDGELLVGTALRLS
jgi:hypothetical protein